MDAVLIALMLVQIMQSQRSFIMQSSLHDATTFDDFENNNVFSMWLMLMLIASTNEAFDSRRKWWKFPRSRTEWEQVDMRAWQMIDPHTRDQKWRAKYKMSFACFMYLVNEISPFILAERKDNWVREPIQVEHAVAMVLFRLTHGHSARQVAERFNVGTSTVKKYTQIITKILSHNNMLYSRFLAIPTGQRLKNIIVEFESVTGIKQICGAIDGTHIKLHQRPANKYMPYDYYSRHKIHSVLLQAVCDSRKIFWDVACRAPGGTHNVTHLRMSSLHEKLCTRLVLNEHAAEIEGQFVQPYIIGDNAYPIHNYCFKPYCTNSDSRKANFDASMFRGRVTIENSFSILKNRWQILRNLNVDVTSAAQVVTACCVLHNCCQIWGESDVEFLGADFLANQNVDRWPERDALENEARAKREGKIVRDIIFRDWARRVDEE